MNSWVEIVLVFLLSTVKFVFGGVPMALGFGFNVFQAITVTSLGGFSGVLFFTYTSNTIIHFLKKRKAKKCAENPGAPVKKNNIKKNRMIISVKNRFGILGFAFLVPVLIPIPIGCFLAVRYFHNKQKILRYLSVSILFWSVIGTLLYKPIFDALRSYFLGS